MALLRLFRECDMFRKLPPEHREAELPEPAAVSVLRIASLVLIAVLTLSETAAFLTPVAKQRFDLDMGESADASAPRKIRVLVNVTVHDFPCIDLSLDYQDVMGTRTTDVRTTIFKQRLHANGSLVGETVNNDPKAAENGGPSNPNIHRNSTGNKTCGNCYGARPDGECCNSCSDVLYAYRLKRWALPRIEDIEQCKNDGTSKLAYQPPQIIRLDDYSSDDYLPKFTRLGSLAPAGSEPRITAPFKLNFTLEPLKPLNLSSLGRTFKPLVLNFSTGDGKAGTTFEDDWGDDFDTYDDGYSDDYDDYWAEGGSGSKKDKSQSAKAWPDCVRQNVIIHGYDVGEALMVDLTPYGAKEGCWNNDCKETDKFSCSSFEGCATVCQKVASCQWWTWGKEDGVAKCWIRTGRHGRGKRYGFSSGARACFPPENSTANASTDSTGTLPESKPAGEAEPETQPRRLSSWDDDYDGYGYGSRPFALNFGNSLHMPVFGMDQREADRRREQRGESCRIHGFFDTNKVPGNFHIGTHGASAPSYITYFDEPAPPTQNMRHTINSLAFIETATGELLNATQPLDGFESPKAFTFQYYLTITPATVSGRGSVAPLHGYQFRAGSFVTNELIGPAVFFRMDIDPIRVTYYTEEVRWSRFLVNICAIVGGCIAVVSMLAQFLESAVALASDKD
uniref:Endoplasmic reticulum vesicle transporter C-terminal domain-containing protein n=1 Tax=Pyrodinium bahamense TaxID=73915 RepID=A0A7R9ZUX1_9DINO|mmetsp:Transcript_10197/g.28461  ORF Transcript_10197/g.28461 Transcript_10197/m.28461 type:complete len:678 (+) Transcript_10197:60-2093(+)